MVDLVLYGVSAILGLIVFAFVGLCCVECFEIGGKTMEVSDMPYFRGAMVKLVVKETPRQILAGGCVPLTGSCTVKIDSWSPSMGSPAVFARGDDGGFIVFDYGDVLSGKIEAVALT